MSDYYAVRPWPSRLTSSLEPGTQGVCSRAARLPAVLRVLTRQVRYTFAALVLIYLCRARTYIPLPRLPVRTYVCVYRGRGTGGGKSRENRKKKIVDVMCAVPLTYRLSCTV